MHQGKWLDPKRRRAPTACSVWGGVSLWATNWQQPCLTTRQFRLITANLLQMACHANNGLRKMLGGFSFA